ncbi:hypothetical protein BU23DRAFT_577755 [Bimuria novae-zelandiae CBS 107.79]|uniref:Uncharacterized protein n=1 Tax=Bimuria novae-zelandiae CBS 107.79 TaxID=1447943 RepID=A0A6A5VMH9_9PLEO|nr:hypothetical protein BU23DRAFT_577755 [Bimuria novae-zelandiae CBS 107.79]
MSIRINATVNEARAAAGHSKEQWDRFYFITKDEAKQLSEAHPDWTRWIHIPANEKDLLLQRINGRLTAEGIPEVEMIILKWRVSQLLRDIQRKYAEGSMISGMAVTGSQPQAEGSTQQSQSPQRSESSPSETRAYDPVRDV